MNARYIYLAVLLALTLAGCTEDEKYVNLGDDFVLFRLHGGVSVEDWKATNGGIPPEIVSLGFDSKHIVADSTTNGTTNVWVIIKTGRLVVGPMSSDAFKLYSTQTNREVLKIHLKNVWDY